MNCETCRFWSDKLAQAMGGPMEAYCLSQDGPLKARYTRALESCTAWQDAPLGAVDSGSDDDPRYGNPYDGLDDVEPTEMQQGLIPIPDGYAEQ